MTHEGYCDPTIRNAINNISVIILSWHNIFILHAFFDVAHVEGESKIFFIQRRTYSCTCAASEVVLFFMLTMLS